jgi:hypothetical protein
MAITDMSSAQLSDGRPQFLAGTQDALFSTWKLTTDPDSAWSGWQPFPTPFGGVQSVASATLTDGRPQIFVCNEFLWTTFKLDPNDPNSAWADWTQFDGSSDAVTVGAATLNDGRPQIFVTDTAQQLSSSWKVDIDPNAAWEPLTAFVPGPGRAVKIVSVRLTDGRPQILVGNSLASTWKNDTDPDSAWVLPWQQMDAPPGGGIQSLAGTSRSDGIPEFVAVDSATGQVWRKHKMDGTPDAAWSDWLPFPDIANASMVAAASLNDGRPQILIDTPAGLFSTWQQDVSDPEKWVDPVPFDAVPGT